MSDRRHFDLHRLAKRGFQGKPVRDALRRLHGYEKRVPWPSLHPPSPAVPGPAQALPVPSPKPSMTP